MSKHDDAPAIPSPTTDDVAQAVTTIIRERLQKGECVSLPDLGTFSVEHKPSEMKKDENGDIIMIPPQDVVTFTPDE